MLESLEIYDELHDKHLDSLFLNKEASLKAFKDPLQEEGTEKELIVSNKWVYEPVMLEGDFDNFLQGVKRKLYLQVLKKVFSFYKNNWARVTIEQTIKKAYIEKYIPLELILERNSVKWSKKRLEI